MTYKQGLANFRFETGGVGHGIIHGRGLLCFESCFFSNEQHGKVCLYDGVVGSGGIEKVRFQTRARVGHKGLGIMVDSLCDE